MRIGRRNVTNDNARNNNNNQAQAGQQQQPQQQQQRKGFAKFIFYLLKLSPKSPLRRLLCASCFCCLVIALILVLIHFMLIFSGFYNSDKHLMKAVWFESPLSHQRMMKIDGGDGNNHNIYYSGDSGRAQQQQQQKEKEQKEKDNSWFSFIWKRRSNRKKSYEELQQEEKVKEEIERNATLKIRKRLDALEERKRQVEEKRREVEEMARVHVFGNYDIDGDCDFELQQHRIREIPKTTRKLGKENIRPDYAVVTILNNNNGKESSSQQQRFQMMNEFSFINKLQYCQHHGYDFISYLSEEEEDDNDDSHKEKRKNNKNTKRRTKQIQQVLLKYLPLYKWILFLEVDALVMDFKFNFEEIITNTNWLSSTKKQREKNVDIIFSGNEDFLFSSSSSSERKKLSGVFFLKNSNFSLTLLKRKWDFFFEPFSSNKINNKNKNKNIFILPPKSGGRRLTSTVKELLPTSSSSSTSTSKQQVNNSRKKNNNNNQTQISDTKNFIFDEKNTSCCAVIRFPGCGFVMDEIEIEGVENNNNNKNNNANITISSITSNSSSSSSLLQQEQRKEKQEFCDNILNYFFKKSICLNKGAKTISLKRGVPRSFLPP